MADNVMRVVIIGDDRAYQQALTRSTASTAKFQKQVEATNLRAGKLGQISRGALSNTGGAGGFLFGSGAFIASASITAALAKSVSAASDLNESISKTNQVFDDSADVIQRWATTTAGSIGISRQAALEAAASFGNMFHTVGLGDAVSADMSKRFVQLAADMASFNNEDPSDMLMRLRSGLAGEAEPLRRFGVLLSESRVQQEAMRETGKTTARSITDQEKVLARYNIILKDTIPQQGDFARTSQGLANQTRVLQANLTDLAATLGGVLVPGIAAGVGEVNDLIGAFKKLGDIDVTPGINFPDPPDWLKTVLGLAPISPLGTAIFAGNQIGGASIDTTGKSVQELEALRKKMADTRGESDVMVAALDRAIRKLQELAAAAGSTAREGRAGGLTGGLLAEIAQRAADASNAKIKSSSAALKIHLKGLGLKLDKAELTKSFDNDIAVLREMERSIQRQITREGRTFDLVSQLVAVRKQIASKIEQRANAAADATRAAADALAEAAQKDRDAWDNALDAMELRLDIAKAQRGFQGDLNVLKKIEALILERIKVEGQTTELLRKLFENRQEQAATRRQLVNSRQFEALGLTAEGEQRTPGSGSLLRRAQSLQNQIKGTALDTNKTRTQLRNIVNVLKGQFGKAGKDVRQAILGMLNDISGALSGGGAGTLPHTAFVKKGIDKLLDGLGLTPEQIKELRQRFAKDGPLGTERGGGGFNRQPRTGNRSSSQEGHETKVSWHIYIDGQEVEARVTRRQQRKSERTAAQRRGANPGTRR